MPIGKRWYIERETGVSIGAYYNWCEISYVPEQSDIWFDIGYCILCLPYDVNRHERMDFIYPANGLMALNPADNPNGRNA